MRQAKNYIQHSKYELLASLVLIGIGCMFLFVPTEVFIYILAVLIAIIAFGMIVSALSRSERFDAKHPFWMTIGQGVLFLVVATTMILFPFYAIRIGAGIIFIVVPLIKLMYAKNKQQFFLKDIYKYIIGIIFILSPKGVLDMIFFVLGVLIIGIAIVIIVFSFKSYRQGKSHSVFYNMAYKKIIVMKKGEKDDEFWDY